MQYFHQALPITRAMVVEAPWLFTPGTIDEREARRNAVVELTKELLTEEGDGAALLVVNTAATTPELLPGALSDLPFCNMIHQQVELNWQDVHTSGGSTNSRVMVSGVHGYGSNKPELTVYLRTASDFLPRYRLRKGYQHWPYHFLQTLGLISSTGATATNVQEFLAGRLEHSRGNRGRYSELLWLKHEADGTVSRGSVPVNQAVS
jgi:hypothetical protein